MRDSVAPSYVDSRSQAFSDSRFRAIPLLPGPRMARAITHAARQRSEARIRYSSAAGARQSRGGSLDGITWPRRGK